MEKSVLLLCKIGLGDHLEQKCRFKRLMWVDYFLSVFEVYFSFFLGVFLAEFQRYMMILVEFFQVQRFVVDNLIVFDYLGFQVFIFFGNYYRGIFLWLCFILLFGGFVLQFFIYNLRFQKIRVEMLGIKVVVVII